MTREEAIKELSVEYLGDSEKIREAKRMAIKALEQEPCADAISRTDAIRVASGYCHWSNIPKELAKLPSVSTEKTGRWIYKTMEGQFCSICDAQSVWKFNYCPNCGARMEAEA